MEIGDYVRDDIGHAHDFAYSYNWPHDFYSLIELGKVTTAATFNPQDASQPTGFKISPEVIAAAFEAIGKGE